MTYPNTTGFVKGSDTSRDSARLLDESGSADSQAAFILNQLEHSLMYYGATADEMTGIMKGNGFPKIHNGTVAGRLVHLELSGQIVKTIEKRRTKSNRWAYVYAHKEHAPPPDQIIPVNGGKKTKDDFRGIAHELLVALQNFITVSEPADTPEGREIMAQARAAATRAKEALR